MGNRGNVIFTDGTRCSPNVYLHWNGSAESVYAFIAELSLRHARSDADYEAARFVQVCGEFFDYAGDALPGHTGKTYDGLSLGVVNGPSEITPEALGKIYTDSGDNGFFVIDRTGQKSSDGWTELLNGNIAVRRFSGWDTPTEHSPAEVAEEIRAAYDSEYRPGLTRFFDEQHTLQGMEIC